MSIEEAFHKKYTRIPLQAKGRVVKILEDDNEVPKHQRFIIEVHPDHTLLIAHNLDRGYRVPVKLDDMVEVKGEYVWNKYGGLMHETHHHQESDYHDDGFISLIS